MKRNVLVVFLASPGDLKPERKLAKGIVEKTNRRLTRNTGWEVELRGWEDAMPAARRPQEVINSDVDACDVFVGLLWKRWGQPTGVYSSGFEEEFERASARSRGTDAPKIWLFFKEIRPNPGPGIDSQLDRVLQFRSDVFNARAIFSKTFRTTGEWSDMLDEYLARHVVDLAVSHLRTRLNQAGATLDELTAGASLGEDPGRVGAEVRRVVSAVKSESSAATAKIDPAWNLDLARGLMARGDYRQAVDHFTGYLGHHPDDYEAHAALGVAYANAHGGHDTDLASVRSYSEAIALAPDDLSEDARARLIGYRGAMLKRLRRLDEAEADLLAALRLASEPDRLLDVHYNLAGVYALGGERQAMLAQVRALGGDRTYLNLIRRRLNTYFRSFKDDPELLALIG